MSVYLVGLIEIRDRESYRTYEAGFVEIFQKYRGEVLAVDEAPEVLEGRWPHTRTVLLRFPDPAAAHAWYDSPEYQALAQHRFRASKGQLALVRGLPGSD